MSGYLAELRSAWLRVTTGRTEPQVLVGANPWPYADLAREAGVELLELDYLPDDVLYLVSPAEAAALKRLDEAVAR